ncbi:class I SAM-dependent methyltransferase, partial [Aerococcus urinae]
MKTNQYALFSEVYHQIFDQSLYQAWQNYLEDQVETRLTHQEGLKILDMACGDGRLTLELAKAGYDVTGMDLSEEMLAIAQAEMQEAGIYIPYFQADMRSFKTETSYDLISIFCD